MIATDYTLDPRNARAIKYLQSRPIQIGEPFATSVALFLDSAGYLSRKQREAIEAIIERTAWKEPDALPPAIDDRGERVPVYVTPGCHPGSDFLHDLAERYKDSGKTGIVMMHDPVYKTILEPSDKSSRGVHRLSTSCGIYKLDGTGYGVQGEKRIDPENAKMLNEVVGPQLSTPDTIYRFRPVKVGKKPGVCTGSWLVFADREPVETDSN